jgi:hypothetical protein
MGREPRAGYEKRRCSRGLPLGSSQGRENRHRALLLRRRKRWRELPTPDQIRCQTNSGGDRKSLRHHGLCEHQKGVEIFRTVTWWLGHW